MSCIYITFQAILDFVFSPVKKQNYGHVCYVQPLYKSNFDNKVSICLILCPCRCGDHGASAPVPCEGGGEHQGVRGAGGARQDGQDPGATGASVSRVLCEHYPFLKAKHVSNA